MLKNLHLVGENEDDDLYSEFKEVDNEVGKAFLKHIYIFIHISFCVDFSFKLKPIALCMLKFVPYVLLLRIPGWSMLYFEIMFPTGTYRR